MICNLGDPMSLRHPVRGFWVQWRRLRQLKKSGCCFRRQHPTTRWRGRIRCLIYRCHFPQKSPEISGSFAQTQPFTEASCGTSLPCTYSSQHARAFRSRIIDEKKFFQYLWRVPSPHPSPRRRAQKKKFNEYKEEHKEEAECSDIAEYSASLLHEKLIGIQRVSKTSTENQRISTLAHSNRRKMENNLVQRWWYRSNKRVYMGSKPRIQKDSWAE